MNTALLDAWHCRSGLPSLQTGMGTIPCPVLRVLPGAGYDIGQFSSVSSRRWYACAQMYCGRTYLACRFGSSMWCGAVFETACEWSAREVAVLWLADDGCRWPSILDVSCDLVAGLVRSERLRSQLPPWGTVSAGSSPIACWGPQCLEGWAFSGHWFALRLDTSFRWWPVAMRWLGCLRSPDLSGFWEHLAIRACRVVFTLCMTAPTVLLAHA